MMTTECTKWQVLCDNLCSFHMKFQNCSISECACIEMTLLITDCTHSLDCDVLCMLSLSLHFVMNIVDNPHWSVRVVGLHAWRHGSECMLCAISRMHWLAGRIFCIFKHFMFVVNERQHSCSDAYHLQLIWGKSVSSCKHSSMQCS